MDEYIGIVKLFAGSFAPRGWAFCDGSLLNISQNTALFSILGTTYGGNGTQTFALPDLRSRVAVGAGNGPGQQPVQSGQVAGSASVTLTTQQLPAHTHAQQFANTAATTNAPGGNMLAQSNGADADGNLINVKAYAPAGSPVAAAPTAIGATGNGLPVNIMPPYLGMNYIICLEGIYPPRN